MSVEVIYDRERGKLKILIFDVCENKLQIGTKAGSGETDESFHHGPHAY